MTSTTAGAAAQGAPPKRRLRNYLLDPRFQLKYAGLLVGVALVLMLALGAVIWQTASIAAQQAHNAVQQSYVAVAQAERAFRESQTSSQIVAMQQLSHAADNPELAETIQRELAEADERATRNLAEVRRERREIDAQRSLIERNRVRTIIALVAAGLALVLLLGLAGVVITHKVVGPVFKLKRLLRQVGTGKLVIKERLRKGDELEDLFDTFLAMVDSLRSHQEGELARLDTAIREAEAAGVDLPVLEKLRALRAEMAKQLGSPDTMRPPPAEPQPLRG